MREKAKMLGPNRSFGLVISAVFVFVAVLANVESRRSFIAWDALAAVFLVISTLAPRLLAPLRSLWMRLGMLLGHVINPVAFGIIYVIAIIPVGAMMRCTGKGASMRSRDPASGSYWRKRDVGALDLASMREQG